MRLGLLSWGFAAALAAASVHGQSAAPIITPTSPTSFAQAPDFPSSSSVLTAPVPSAAPDPKSCCTVLAGTPVEIEVSESVTSQTAHPGDSYELKLARDLMMDGVVVVAAGAPGRGEVIDAGPGGFAGRPGKLILAARWIKAGDTRLPLRGLRLAGSGRDVSKSAAMVVLAIGVVGMAMQGGDVNYPSGTRAMAKVATDTFIPLSDQPVPTNPLLATDQAAPAQEKKP